MKRITIVVGDTQTIEVLAALMNFTVSISIENISSPLKLETPPVEKLRTHTTNSKKTMKPPSSAGRKAILEYASKHPTFSPTEVRKANSPSIAKAISNALNGMRVKGEVEKIGSNPLGAGFSYKLSKRGEDAERLLSHDEESRKATEG